MKKGFKSISLLVVLVILTVITAVATSIIISKKNESKIDSDISIINSILDTAVELYDQAYLSGELESIVGINLLDYEGFKIDNDIENAIISFDDEGNTTVVLYNNGNCYVKIPGVDITYEESTLEECLESYVVDYSDNSESENIETDYSDDDNDFEEIESDSLDNDIVSSSSSNSSSSSSSNSSSSSSSSSGSSGSSGSKDTETDDTDKEIDDVDNSGASAPILGDLIPVTIATDGTVTVVDSSTQWYNYEEQTWANAIVLNDGLNSSIGDTFYLNASGTYDEIAAIYVWVPRYEYQIQKTEESILINFVSSSVTTASDDYILHSAFTFDEEELDGIWVGKFEVTGATESLTTLPNVTSLRSVTISSFYYAMLDFADNYSLSGDSHMMKNTDWGAVAYLSLSVYGINEEVYINNASTYTTGCGGDTVSESSNSTCTNAYGSVTDDVYNQSTTGNISGIFDMSGGALEYVMGNYNYSTQSSGFTDVSAIDSKYINIYMDFESIIGDAVDETSAWYSDGAHFYSSYYPWLGRGGLYYDSYGAGVFAFCSNFGYASSYYSSRMVFVVS
ncbi:MAG: hypothetical protein R3Y21_01940 [Mycoplasmatota bacterium]